jgi:hypothetical protein
MTVGDETAARRAGIVVRAVSRFYRAASPQIGHPKQSLAAIHFGPDLWGCDPEFAPQHNEIVEEVDALMDDRRPLPANGVDDDFRRFFSQLLCEAVAWN